jgi:hypothetical protein
MANRTLSSPGNSRPTQEWRNRHIEPPAAGCERRSERYFRRLPDSGAPLREVQRRARRFTRRLLTVAALMALTACGSNGTTDGTGAMIESLSERIALPASAGLPTPASQPAAIPTTAPTAPPEAGGESGDASTATVSAPTPYPTLAPTPIPSTVPTAAPTVQLTPTPQPQSPSATIAPAPLHTPLPAVLVVIENDTVSATACRPTGNEPCAVAGPRTRPRLPGVPGAGGELRP